MEKEAKKSNGEGSRERVNQFIIECMFSKYFAEQQDNKIAVRREKVTA